MTRSRRALAVIVLLVAAVIGAWSVVTLTAALAPDRAGSLDDLQAVAGPEPSAPVTRAPGPAPSPAPTPAVAPEVDRIATRDARLIAQPDAATPSPVPERLRIRGLGIDAPVDAVGVDRDGSIAVPQDVRRVGWYRHGAAPGAAVGSVVLTGHVDSRQQGPGAFFELATIEPGEVIEVAVDGDVLRYEVTGRDRLEKSELPLDQLFRRDGPEVLTLVTCGGPFDEATRSYRDNVVVVATRVA